MDVGNAFGMTYEEVIALEALREMPEQQRKQLQELKEIKARTEEQQALFAKLQAAKANEPTKDQRKLIVDIVKWCKEQPHVDLKINNNLGLGNLINAIVYSSVKCWKTAYNTNDRANMRFEENFLTNSILPEYIGLDGKIIVKALREERRKEKKDDES